MIFRRPIVAAGVGLLIVFTSGSCEMHRGSDGESGIVTVVHDGDTVQIRLDDGRRETVRLIGIDSPELDDSRESVRFLAHAAKRFCFTRLYRRRVRLIYDWEKRDRYGRLLAYLKIDEDIFNETILREGFAAVFLKFPFREDFRRRFERAALKARAEGRGLWSPVPYPVIGPGEAKSFLERLASVRFRCSGIRRKGNLTLLEAEDGAFAALIRKRDRNRFPDPERIRGREISVTGLIEDYRGQPQVMLSQPSQIEFLKSSELRR